MTYTFMTENFVDSWTLLNKTYDSLLEHAISSNTVVPNTASTVHFSSVPKLVESWRKEHDADESFAVELGKNPENRTPFDPETVGIYSLIADDSDYHRTRKGFFKYSNGFFLPVKDQQWLVSRGVSCGSYPAHSYHGDIAAVPVLKTLDETIQQLSAPYFRNSLLVVERWHDKNNFAIGEKSRFSQFYGEIETVLRTGVDESINEPVKYPRYNTVLSEMMAQLFRSILERSLVPKDDLDKVFFDGHGITENV